MTVVYPEGTPTLGNTKVTAVLSVANLAAPKLATEIGAVTSVDLSCYLMASGFNPTATTNKGTKPRRLCSRRTLEQFNATTYGFDALQYVHNPQGADIAVGNEARKLLKEGVKVYLIERQGLDAQTDTWTVGEFSIGHYIQLGPQIKSGDRTDENGEFYITQEVIYLNDGPVDGIIAT